MRVLGKLAETYVDAISSGKIPCLDNAVLALSEIENSGAVERARVFYQENMALTVVFPTETQKDLSEIHYQIQKKALAIFMKNTFKDEKQKHQKRLAQLLQTEYQQIWEKNCQESKRVCESIIKLVFGALEEEGSSVYTVPGGYNKYCTDLQMMIQKYKATEGKGVKAEEVLKVYLDGLASLGQTILTADKALSKAQQRAKEEEARRVQAERERRAAEEESKRQKKLQEDQERIHQQHLAQLREKMEVEKRNAAAEYERVQAAKLEELRLLHERGLKDRAEKERIQLEKLQAQMRADERRREEDMREANKSSCILL